MVYKNLKPIESVIKKNRSLLLFNHGLGDLINYLPVHMEFCRQTRKKVTLASSAKRQFHLIDSNIISLNGDETSLRSKFDYIYRVHYPDSIDSSYPIELHNEAAKPYLCAIHELGMQDFTWKPFKMNNASFDPYSKRVGVHLFGHTGMINKFVPADTINRIWGEIEDAGFEPFETHMRPDFSKEYKLSDRGSDNLPFATADNSLRFEKANLERMIEEIGKCRFFIGVDSGPIYLAGALLGHDRLIGLVNGKRHDHFMPCHISTINVKSYKEGTVKRILKQKSFFL